MCIKDGKICSVVFVLCGMFYEVDLGLWKFGEKFEFKYFVSVDYYKFEIDGWVWYEMDVFGCKCVIDGVD